jgi:hypothetical protein
MEQTIREFLRRPDGASAVSHNGTLLSDSIPEKWLESEICEPMDFADGNAMTSVVSWIGREST